MLTLYHNKNSASSQKVRLCLAEKSLGFDSKIINTGAGDNLTEHYLTINPDGLVPSLDDSGFVISESAIINEYLDQQYPSMALRPESPHTLAHMRLLVHWANELHHPYLRILTHFCDLISPGSAPYPKQALSDKADAHPVASRKSLLLAARDNHCDKDLAIYEVKRQIQKLHTFFSRSDGSFLLGESVSLADLNWVTVFHRLKRLDLLDECLNNTGQRLKLWWQLMQARDSFQTAILDWQ